MTVEEALTLAKTLVLPEGLTQVQETIFCQSWQGLSYQEISQISAYDAGYIKDAGGKLWQALSRALGQKVTKKNYQGIFLKHQQTLQHKQDQRQKPSRHHDWEIGLNLSSFYGRKAELASLKAWILSEHCRLITVLGMAGMGKTALVAHTLQQVQDQFDYVRWVSLRNSLAFVDFITDLLSTFSEQAEIYGFDSPDAQIAQLLTYFAQQRCLIVLDNAESILQSGDRAGRYRDGYESYGQLLRQVAEARHQSCLIVTSREAPSGTLLRDGPTSQLRSQKLEGLPLEAANHLLTDKGLAESSVLVEHYAGNPLAIKIAATMIQQLFAGDMDAFLSQGTLVFGGIWDLLEQQFQRLSSLEQQLLYYLAQQQGWVTIPNLLAAMETFTDGSRRMALDTLESLQRRSLIETSAKGFTLQTDIMEYVRERQQHQD